MKEVEGMSLSTLKRIARAEGIRRNIALLKPALSKEEHQGLTTVGKALQGQELAAGHL